MSKEQIIEKIQKLLKLSKSDNPSEAASALAFAQKLMAKYNVTVTEADESTSIVEERVSSGTKSVSKYQWILAKELSKHFACRLLKEVSGDGSQRMMFVGEELNVITFRECYNFAYKAYQKLSGQFLNKLDKSVDKTQARWDYFTGFHQGLTNELIRSESENALVIRESEALKEHMDSLSLGTFKLSLRQIQSAQNMEAGYKDGTYAFRNKNKAVEG